MTYNLCAYNHWSQCLRITENDLELIVTLDAGPRIIRFGFRGGQNEFQEYPDQALLRNDGKYHSYGGHRLWVAPETEGWTNCPDNNPVEWSDENGALTFTAPCETSTKLQKQITISFDEHRSRIRILHTISNCGEKEISLAPWAISVMAPGGIAIMPQEPFVPHPQRVLPVRPLALWSYTNMQDSRWMWGSRYITLRQNPNISTPQKCGARISQGWTAYYNDGHLFIKFFHCFADATYPDFGCNAEVFTNEKMLEVESLGPLIELKPYCSITHEEQWLLLKDIPTFSTEDELDALLKSIRDKLM